MQIASFVCNRRTLTAVCTATLVTLLSACASKPPVANLNDAIANQPSLSTFNGLLRGSAVAQTLQGPGPFTVFAPNNDAFKSLPASTLDDLKAHPEKLNALLKYHVSNGATLASAVTQNAKVATLHGAELDVSKAGEFLTVDSALVTQPDAIASNGVLQIVDTVLTPPVKK